MANIHKAIINFNYKPSTGAKIMYKTIKSWRIIYPSCCLNNIQTTLQLLYKTHKSPKLNTWEQFEIYEHHETHKNEALCNQIIYSDHLLYDLFRQ